MTDNLRLMCVLAHPDDESLGMGGTMAKYASEGIGTYLVTATRGERCIREASFLDSIDGELDEADVEALPEIVLRIGRQVDAELRPETLKIGSG